MKAYISGQISGLDIEEAKQLFQKAHDFLTDCCEMEAVNPFHLFSEEEEEKLNWKEFMIRDICCLLHSCNTIYMLKNWKNSRGARIEHTIAIESDMTIIYEK